MHLELWFNTNVPCVCVRLSGSYLSSIHILHDKTQAVFRLEWILQWLKWKEQRLKTRADVCSGVCLMQFSHQRNRKSTECDAPLVGSSVNSRNDCSSSVASYFCVCICLFKAPTSECFLRLLNKRTVGLGLFVAAGVTAVNSDTFCDCCEQPCVWVCVENNLQLMCVCLSKMRV